MFSCELSTFTLEIITMSAKASKVLQKKNDSGSTSTTLTLAVAATVVTVAVILARGRRKRRTQLKALKESATGNIVFCHTYVQHTRCIYILSYLQYN